jgi:DNA mismatch endonuclease (patch repair protein)
MADNLTNAERSRLMARVRTKDTGPEMVVRRFLHVRGFRYRLHDRNLPGRPDLVFPGRKIAVFVHGCFWHRHPGCSLSYTPKTRVDFWKAKFAQNIERDRRVTEELQLMGFRVLVVWECMTRRADLSWLTGALETPDP